MIYCISGPYLRKFLFRFRFRFRFHRIQTHLAQFFNNKPEPESVTAPVPVAGRPKLRFLQLRFWFWLRFHNPNILPSASTSFHQLIHNWSHVKKNYLCLVISCKLQTYSQLDPDPRDGDPEHDGESDLPAVEEPAGNLLPVPLRRDHQVQARQGRRLLQGPAGRPTTSIPIHQVLNKCNFKGVGSWDENLVETGPFCSWTGHLGTSTIQREGNFRSVSVSIFRISVGAVGDSLKTNKKCTSTRHSNFFLIRWNPSAKNWVNV